MTELIGAVLHDTYRVLEEVGRSCLGTVYAAEVISGAADGAEVTVLAVQGNLVRGERFTELFRGEVQKLSQLDCPGVAQVLASAPLADSVFAVFDCSPRLPTLRSVLAETHQLPVARALRIGQSLAQSLAAAQAGELYHGFLRPEVILLREDDSVCLREYGLFAAVDLAALLTAPCFYSSAYLAPERSCREPADARADLYAFGVILAEMVSGEAPQLGESLPTYPSVVASAIAACLDSYKAAPLAARDLVDLLAGIDRDAGGAEDGVAPVAGALRVQPESATWAGTCPEETLDTSMTLPPGLEDAAAPFDAELLARVGSAEASALEPDEEDDAFGRGPVLVGDTDGASGGRWDNLAATYSDSVEGKKRPSGRGDPATLPFGVLPADLEPITPDNAAAIRRLQRLGRGRAFQVAYSPDGQYLALATSLGVELWACDSWHMKYIMRDHPCQVAAVAFSPDGQYMASASWDNSLSLWDMQTGEPISRLNGHDGSVLAVQFHPLGHLLASAGEDERISLWDVETRTRLGVLEGHTSFVRRLAFSHDGRILASASTDGTVRLWDASCLRAGPVLRTEQGGAVWALAYSPTRHLLATGGSDKEVVLWDTLQGRQLGNLRGHCGMITALAFDPFGKLLASAGSEGVILLWDVQRGRQIGLLEGHVGGITDLAISPDGKILASTGRDRRVRLWNLKTGHLAHYLDGYTPQMTCLAFSQDGKVVAAGNDEATIQLWSLAQPMEVMSVKGHSGLVHSVGFSADDRTLISASRDQTVRLWDPFNGGQLRVLQGHEGPVYVTAMSPDGELIASGGMDGQVILWNAKSGTILRAIRAHVGGVLSLAFDPAGQTFASGGADETIRFWQIETGRPLQQLWSCKGVIRGLAYSREGDMLASAGGDGSVRLWDVRHIVELGILRGHTADVNSVSFSPDGRLLASAGDDNTVRIWDVHARREVVQLAAHTAWVNAVCFSPDGTLLASGSMDGTIRLWGVSS